MVEERQTAEEEEVEMVEGEEVVLGEPRTVAVAVAEVGMKEKMAALVQRQPQPLAQQQRKLTTSCNTKFSFHAVMLKNCNQPHVSNAHPLLFSSFRGTTKSRSQ